MLGRNLKEPAVKVERREGRRHPGLLRPLRPFTWLTSLALSKVMTGLRNICRLTLEGYQEDGASHVPCTAGSPSPHLSTRRNALCEDQKLKLFLIKISCFLLHTFVCCLLRENPSVKVSVYFHCSTFSF